LRGTLAAHWGIAGPLRYLPVGFGTHHYRAGDDWFVNVDEPGSRHGLERATATAAALRDGASSSCTPYAVSV
jgi:hypothetical protein